MTDHPSGSASSWQIELLPQNFLHRLSLCELINQLIQVANLLHQRIFDVFYPNAAHYTLDKRTIRMKCWSLSEERFNIAFVLDLLP